MLGIVKLADRRIGIDSALEVRATLARTEIRTLQVWRRTVDAVPSPSAA